MNKAVSSTWFSGRDCVGIVLCQDDITEEYKAYIGVGRGEDEAADILHIMNWGTTFPLQYAKQIFPYINMDV